MGNPVITRGIIQEIPGGEDWTKRLFSLIHPDTATPASAIQTWLRMLSSGVSDAGECDVWHLDTGDICQEHYHVVTPGPWGRLGDSQTVCLCVWCLCELWRALQVITKTVGNGLVTGGRLFIPTQTTQGADWGDINIASSIICIFLYKICKNLLEFGQLTTGHDDGHKEAAKKWVSCANSRKWLFWLSIKMSASVLNEWAAISRGGWALNPRRRRGWGTRPLNEAIIAKTGASLEIIPEKVPKNIASSCLVAPSWRSYQVFSGAEPLVDIEIKPETYFRF